MNASNPLRDCDKWCVANVDGKCAVEDCGGPITALSKTQADIYLAAKYYSYFLSMFRVEFDEEADHG